MTERSQNPDVNIPALAAQLAAFPIDVNGLAHRIARLPRADLLVLVGRIAGEPNGKRVLKQLDDACTFFIYGDVD